MSSRDGRSKLPSDMTKLIALLREIERSGRRIDLNVGSDNVDYQRLVDLDWLTVATPPGKLVYTLTHEGLRRAQMKE